MKKTILLIAAATALAACAYMPFGDDEEDAPSVAATPAPVTVAAHTYEIKDADRGPVRRVKVLLDGRTVETLVMSRSRKSSSSYCCTPDGCQEVEATAACATFKMTCDKHGACVRIHDGTSRL